MCIAFPYLYIVTVVVQRGATELNSSDEISEMHTAMLADRAWPFLVMMFFGLGAWMWRRRSLRRSAASGTTAGVSLTELDLRILMLGVALWIFTALVYFYMGRNAGAYFTYHLHLLFPLLFVLGAYAATAQVIPCTFKGRACNFVAQMYVDNAPPLAGGREIWGYPMKFGKPVLTVMSDTLTGTLDYAHTSVARGTMSYKHRAAEVDARAITGRTQVTLKVIPHVDGRPAVAQLVGVDFTDVVLKGAWAGGGRLDMTPNVNAPLADLPVLAMVGGLHLVTDLTLPYGTVLHDYLG
jgi:acetoacetate decarboxylase